MTQRVISLRLDSKNPKHQQILEWIESLPDSGRGKVQYAHIELAMIEYVKKQLRQQKKLTGHTKEKVAQASHVIAQPEKSMVFKEALVPTEPITSAVKSQKKEGTKGVLSEKYKNFLSDTDFG